MIKAADIHADEENAAVGDYLSTLGTNGRVLRTGGTVFEKLQALLHKRGHPLTIWRREVQDIFHQHMRGGVSAELCLVQRQFITFRAEVEIWTIDAMKTLSFRNRTLAT